MLTTFQLPKFFAVVVAVLGVSLAAANTGRAGERDDMIYTGQKIVLAAHFSAQEVEMVDYRWVGNSLNITMKWKGALSGAQYKSTIWLDYTGPGGTIKTYSYSDNAVITWSGRGVQAAVNALNR